LDEIFDLLKSAASASTIWPKSVSVKKRNLTQEARWQINNLIENISNFDLTWRKSFAARQKIRKTTRICGVHEVTKYSEIIPIENDTGLLCQFENVRRQWRG
jgi:hypothetical protein